MNKYRNSAIIITLVSAIIMPLACQIYGVNNIPNEVLTLPRNFHEVAMFSNLILTSLITGIIFALLGFILYNKKLQKVFYVTFYLITILIILIDLFCIAHFKLMISPPMMAIIADTNNMSEITSFFGNYFGLGSLLLVIIVVGVGISLWIYSEKILNLTVKYKKAAISIISILFILSICGVRKIGGFTASPPIMKSIYCVKYMYKVQHRLAKMTNDKTNRVELITNNSDTPYFVFVIGESEARHFMGMYNNKYDSTPLCQKLIDKGNMFAFKDTISMKSSTALVMTPLLSFMNNETEKSDVSSFDPIVDVFTKAGYQAFWISNHEKITKDLSYATYMSTRCDYSTFTSKTSGNAEFTPWLCLKDEVVLPHYDEYLKNNAINKDKNLFIFQLMGSHIKYKDRFPESFAKFKGSDITEPNFDNIQKDTLADYLNTVYYTDYILNEIISRLEDKDAILVYTPDHGEEMWQGGFHGHGPSDVSKYMVEIPMLIWVSDKYKEKRSELVERIQKSLDKPFMTDDLVHVLLDLAGIKTKQFDPSRSLINDKYQVRDRKINGVKYEDLRK